MKERLASAEQTPNGVPPFPGGPKEARPHQEGLPPFAFVLMARAGASGLVRQDLKDQQVFRSFTARFHPSLQYLLTFMQVVGDILAGRKEYLIGRRVLGRGQHVRATGTSSVVWFIDRPDLSFFSATGATPGSEGAGGTGARPLGDHSRLYP